MLVDVTLIIMTVLGGVLAVRVLLALPPSTAPHDCRFGTVTVTVAVCICVYDRDGCIRGFAWGSP